MAGQDGQDRLLCCDARDLGFECGWEVPGVKQTARLKSSRRGSDAPRMGARELACPLCDADLVLAGDERAGDVVYCTFCGAPFMLQKRPETDDDSRWELEEEF